MSLRVLILLIVAALAVVAAPAAAGERTAILDPSACEVSFVLQATGHKVRGVFAVESGELRWDPETGAASGEIVVDAAGGDTGNPRRDEKMHRVVLESARHPRFVFDAQRLEGEIALDGRSEARLSGALSVHGREHPVALTIEVEARDGRFEATAAFDVPYVDWGLEDPSVFVLRVAKSVAVTVELAGSLEEAGDDDADAP